MKKKLLSRLISLTLSAVLCATGFSTPVKAMEGEELIEVGAAEQFPEEEIEPDFEEEAEPVSDEAALQEAWDEAKEADELREEPAEEEIEAYEDAAFESEPDAVSNTVPVNFHSNYHGNDKVVKKSYDKASTSEEAIDVTKIFAAADIGEADKFEGWAFGENIVATVSEKDIVTYAADNSLKAVDVYAQWASLGTYTVTFDPNWPSSSIESDRTANVEDKELCDISEPFMLNGNEYYCKGYVLSGWKYQDAKGKTVLLKTASATLKSLRDTDGEAVTLTAQWKPVTYTLVFDANGGKFSKGTTLKINYKVEDKTRQKIPFPGFKLDENGTPYLDPDQTVISREGYIFRGWSEAPAASSYYGGNTFASFNSFHAMWQAKPVTLKFNPNGGTIAYYDEEADEADFTTEPYIVNSYYSYSYDGDYYAPFRTGYTFKGWMATVKGKSKVLPLNKYFTVKDLDIPADAVVELTAQWTQESNKIEVDLEGGTVKKMPASYKTGSGIAIPSPVKEGYAFAGWTIRNHGYEWDEEDILDSDHKIREEISGDLLLVANWTPVTYTVEFYSNDGKTLFEECTLENNVYDSVFDFAFNAKDIEESEKFDGASSIKGFATAPGSSKISYQLNKKYTHIAGKAPSADGNDIVIRLYAVTQPKVYRIFYYTQQGTVNKPVYTYSNLTKQLDIKATATMTGATFKGWSTASDSDKIVWDDSHTYVKALAAGAAEDVYLVAIYGDYNKYTVTLMPNGNGVKDSEGKEVAAVGVKYAAPDLASEFAYYNEYAAPSAEDLGWSRKGYTFAGFSTTANGKVMVDSLSELGKGKASDVKLYAVWQANQHEISLDSYSFVYRNGAIYTDGFTPQFKLKTYNLKQTYGKKAVVLPTIKSPGFTFIGWQTAEGAPENAGFVYTDGTNKYIKAVAADNDADVILYPAFEENSYSIYVDPNGGQYKGNSGKQLLGKVYYSDEIVGYIEDVYKNSAKAGHFSNTVSLTKNNKSALRWTYNGEPRYGKNCALSEKNGDSVVLYSIYYKINLANYTSTIGLAGIYGDTLTMKPNRWWTTDNYVMQYEYSTNPYFLFNNHKVDVIGNTTDNSATVTIVPGKTYYVRIRIGVKDSIGQLQYGSWSKAVKAKVMSK